MGVLTKTTTYLVGQMQYADGTEWRNQVKSRLEPRGIICFDPYQKPFVHDVEEGNEIRDELLQKLEEADYDTVSKRMRKVRMYDLNLVDRSDFIIAYLNLAVPTCGTWEEIFNANRMKKPIFLIMEGGKKKTPLWMFGTIPHKYIYASVDEALNIIEKIDEGTMEIDSNRWRLLKEHYR